MFYINLITQQFLEGLRSYILHERKQKHWNARLLDPSHTPDVWQSQDSNLESNSESRSHKSMAYDQP